MSLAFRAFPSLGVVALFEETSGGGSGLDPSAPCNAPAYDPNDNLDKIKMHSALDNLEVVVDTTVTVTHASVAGSSSGGFSGAGGGTGTGGNGVNNTTRYGQGSEDLALVTHSLGYIPDFVVTVGGVAVSAYPVQISGHNARYISAYATTTEIRLAGVSVVDGTGLSGVNIDYSVMVFGAARDASGDQLMSVDSSTGEVTFGFDRFSSLRKYLQVLPDGVGSPFLLPYGTTIDANNGASRQVAADGSLFEPVPSTQQGRLVATYGSNHVSSYIGAWSASMAYGGSLAAPAGVKVQGAYDTGIDGGKGFKFDPAAGRLTFVNGVYLTSSSDGTLVNVQTASYSFSQTATLPDVGKDICYYWSAVAESIGGGPTEQAQACACYITATPGESSTKTVLMAAPAGADFIVGQVRLSRTTAPANTWLARTVAMLPVASQWMSIFGSFSALLEAEVNLSRSISIYIDGSQNLVLETKQSVGPAAGGFGTFPDAADFVTYYNKGSLVFRTTAGTPVFLRASQGSSFAGGGSLFTGPSAASFQLGGGSACASNDTTDYESDYLVEIENLRFGRRS